GLIETVMVHHQRYFPVEKAQGGNGDGRATCQQCLLPYFITIANNDRDEAQSQIKQGNEKVLRARLADGRFFYFDDQKTKLAERRAELANLTFQEGLGTYKDKVNRLVETAKLVAGRLEIDEEVCNHLKVTMELCKLDLVSNLVRELPELQGFVGSWYAKAEGNVAPEVVQAMSSHYAPRSTDDAIPQDLVG